MTLNAPSEGFPSTGPSPRPDWSHSNHIKRESRHIYNKLHSISHDSTFVHRIASLFPSLLLTANLRCGAWYTDPSITSAVSYFKSTDGHTHQWGFSLKRSNLHLVAPIEAAGGAIVVDSTRRGKSMPDALSKTIPIWCAVLNRASCRRYRTPVEGSEGFGLETPDWMIPPTEHDQIEARIDGFVEAFLDSDLEVPRLVKPLRSVFVTPQTVVETIQARVGEGEFTPILLVSASRFVSDSAGLGESSKDAGDSFVYVQGAGDDHENWARGLTPDVFWKHHDRLLACTKDEIEALVDSIVAEEASSGSGKNGHWFTPSKNTNAIAANAASDTASGGDTQVGDTRIFIGTRPADHVFSTEDKERYDLIVHFTSLPQPVAESSSDIAESLSALDLCSGSSRLLTLHMTPNKKGLSTIRTIFPPAIDRAYTTLSALTDSRILICCQDAKDLSSSLAVAILASCFTDQRQLILDDSTLAAHRSSLSKDTTKRRLQWLVSSNPRAAPSRAFLLRVNELLISPRHRPSPAS